MKLLSVRSRAILIAFALCQVGLLAAPQNRSDQAPTMAEVSEWTIPLMASLTGEDANGRVVASATAFFLAPSLVVTDYRAVKNAVKIHARSGRGEPFDVKFLAVDERRTVAVLKTDYKPTAKAAESPGTPLRIRNAGEGPSLRYIEQAEVGQMVYVFSNYGGTGALTVNSLDEFRNESDQRYLHLTSALPIESAGSPILNMLGHVVGMVVVAPSDGTGLTLAIPVGQISGCGLEGFKTKAAIPEPRIGEIPVGATTSVPRGAPGGVSGGAPGSAPRESGAVNRDEARNDGLASSPIRKSAGVLQGIAIRRVQPSYSPLAKAARVSGAVIVEVTVDESGDVISARGISGHPLLKDGAVAAARAWKFKPTLLAGTAVKVIGTITFNFSI